MARSKEHVVMVTFATAMGVAKVHFTNLELIVTYSFFKVFRNQNGYINSRAIFTDPCENSTCVEGEVCEEGICNCNMSSTCGGNETVNYCDFKSSQCKCAENVDACSEGQKCIYERCEGT